VVFLVDGAPQPSPPRVAFAIGTRVGNAVVRNRLRRRLRAVFAEGAGADTVPAGAYLVSAQPAAAALSYTELSNHVRRALSRLDEGNRRS
jgi:ribonuclease P protein component